mgnify:CR=1 FL=1
MDIETQTKKSMQDAIRYLKDELKNLRTSRANPSLLDSLQVEVYGALMRLKDVANVTVPEPRQLLITPFDQNNASAIAKAIEQANMGIMPIVDANAVRLNIPPMDESTRKEIVKQCKRKAEDAKVSIRQIRRESNDKARKAKDNGDIPEDLLKKKEKSIQELTDTFCKEIDQLASQKEKEILEI